MSTEGSTDTGADAIIAAAADATNVTDDGTGGKASFLTDPKADAGADSGKTATDAGKVDLKALLGDELSADKNFAKFMESENPVQEMAKSLLEAQKLVGKPKVGVPSEQSTPEEKTAFYKELGVPETSDGYEFKKPEGIPDEAYSEEDAKAWADFFKENNLTKEQANNARNRFIEMQTEAQTAATTALNEQLNKAFGDKKAAITAEATAELVAAIPDAALRDQISKAMSDELTPAFALAMGHLVQSLKVKYGRADSNVNDGDSVAGMTAEEVRALGKAKMASEAYRDPMHRDHKATREEADRYYKQYDSMKAAEQLTKTGKK